MSGIKNYVSDAVNRFMFDHKLRVGDQFVLVERRSKSEIGNGYFSKSYMFVLNGLIRNDLLMDLLSGRYEIKNNEAFEVSEPVRIRGFELIEGADGARLPERGTEHSAGYDFFAKEDVKILPHTINVAWTGVKAYMPPDEVLKVYNRSSNAKKKGLMLSNGVGIVDSDYYNNPDNEGDIGFAFYNFTNEIVIIRKGEKLGQGIFEKFALADNDIHGGKRTGGFGSTGK